MPGTPLQKIEPPSTPAEARARPPRRPRRRLRLVVAAVALVAVVAAAVAWRATHRAAPLQIDTAQADRGRIVAKVTATGTLSAIVTVQVGSQVSGRVAALYADFNSRVKKGQLIAKIDPALFQAAVEQARANRTAAEGNLAKARAQALDATRQYQRNQQLAAQKLISQADLDTSQSNADAATASVRAAEGTLEQAKAALHQSQVNLAYTDIVSPTNGVVISRSVDVGQTVAASLQAPTIFVIAEDLSKMQVDTSVAEADVGRLTDGMSVTFGVDAYPNEAFKGVVRQIRNAPQTVQNVVTYDAVIDVSNPDLKLRPGMTANVTFVYAQKDDVLRVPNAALRFRPPPEMLAAQGGGARGGAGAQGTSAAARGAGGAGSAGAGVRRTTDASDRKTVWVMKGGSAQPVRVRTGISDGSVTELVEGEVQPGDAVVTDASAGARAGGSNPVGRRMF